MKILVISDSHGNVQNLKHAVGFGKKIGVKAVIHCGDWNNVQSVEVVIESKIPLYSTLGNADISPEIRKFLESKCKKFDPELLAFSMGGKKIAISHYISKLKKHTDAYDIGFYGHRHTPDETKFGDIKLVRPGALEKDINFVVYDTDINKVEFINDKV